MYRHGRIDLDVVEAAPDRTACPLSSRGSKIEAKLPPAEKRILAMHNLAVRLRVLCELVLLNCVGLLTKTGIHVTRGNEIKKDSCPVRRFSEVSHYPTSSYKSSCRPCWPGR